MLRPWCRWWAIAAVLLLAVACNRSSPSTPHARFVPNTDNPAAAYVELTGIPSTQQNTAKRLSSTAAEWQTVMVVRAVPDDGARSPTTVAGKYVLDGETVRFTPLFPFDPGRKYVIEFFPPAAASDLPVTRSETFALPALPAGEPVSVTDVYPGAEVLPENQLRMYIHFSGPMGRRGGLEHIRLLDHRGREVEAPFLPLDAEFWNDDRTRYTVFFDPGRQKRGILPNREMGPSLVAGRHYSLVVRREWLDGQGKPLREAFTRRFRVGPPLLKALDPKRWQVVAPAEGTRDPLTVTVPEPLDHGLLLRALGVRRDGQPLVGELRIEDHETRWVFTPREPWTAARHELVALSFLEDLAGNRIGRAFEVDSFERVDKTPEPDVVLIPFTLGGRVR